MNTPITDASNMTRYVNHYEGYSALLDLARRLETDRAALIEALEELQAKHEKRTGLIDWPSTKALAAARANFPTL